MKHEITTPMDEPPEPKLRFSQFWWVILVIVGAVGILIVLWLNGSF
jgi:predicted cobalt transporter CbtA